MKWGNKQTLKLQPSFRIVILSPHSVAPFLKELTQDRERKKKKEIKLLSGKNRKISQNFPQVNHLKAIK